MAGALAFTFLVLRPSHAADIHAGSVVYAIDAPLDPLLDRMPALRSALEWLSERLGYVMGLSCGTPIAALLFWAFVIVPRRLDRWLDGLERSGWSRVSADDPEARSAFARLTPLLRAARPIAGAARGELRIRRALRNGSRYLARAWQSVPEMSRGHTTNVLHRFFVVVEPRPLGVTGELFITGRHGVHDIPNPEARIAGTDARAVNHGLDPIFARHYSVYARGDAPVDVPDRLQRALVELAPLLVAGAGPRWTSHWLPDSNLRVGPDGWGFTCGDLSRREVMDEIPRVADAVSGALR